jgi:glycerol-3-phosphate dehydrogenase
VTGAAAAGGDRPADVAVIGAGVVGTAIARALAVQDVSCVLIDAANDVGTGTSKANTAILHTGFDTVPGSLESRLLRRGYALLGDYAQRAGIPVERTGALLVAWTAEQLAELPAIEDKARRNGVTDTRRAGADELYRREPALGPGALGALVIPGESIICPWTTPLAYATEALAAGARLRLRSRVTAIRSGAAEHQVVTGTGVVRCRWVVNAAGLYSDAVDAMMGGQDLTICPRRGELIVFDKLARPLLSEILLPVPTARTKGVLVAPTVYGNVLLGPTAEDVPGRGDVATTAAGLAALMEAGRRVLPGLAAEEVTASYAGLRAATADRDYRIWVDGSRRYACVAGIRSTGLSASLGIAEYVTGLMADAGLALAGRPEPDPPVTPYIGQAGMRPYQDAARIAADPAYGEIVCHCERVTRGEIRDALGSPLPPADTDGLRRRTRALGGRCQGFYCAATVAQLFAGPGPGCPAPPPVPGRGVLGDRPRGSGASGMTRGGAGQDLPPRAGTAKAPATESQGPRASGGSGPSGVRGCPPDDAVLPRTSTADVLIVGAGPAGLAAAVELRRLGAGSVLVADRDEAAGGIPRHSAHTGFGARDLHRVLTGPAYARRYADLAAAAGADIRLGTTVTGWDGTPGGGSGRDGDPRRVTLTSPAGIETVAARAVLLATGCRERPRTARLVPGDRPPGVMTTGELQRRVYLAGPRLPGRALVVGAEHVSFSAMVTLAHAGARVVALVTGRPRHTSYPGFALAAAWRWHVPVWPGTVVARVAGRVRLEGVELGDLRTGGTRFVPCDLVVFTGDWVPDHELARAAGLAIDPGTRGPAVDTALETSVPGVFAAGNLVHAAETADIAALGGRHAARGIAAFLRGGAGGRDGRGRGAGAGPATEPVRVPVTAEPPLLWVAPNVLRAGGAAPPRGRFVLRSDTFSRLARLEVWQDGRRLAATAAYGIKPDRPVRLGASWTGRADPGGGPVTVRLA